MSSHNLKLSPEAEHDIATILRYTEEQWGEEQADRYEQQVMQALTRLARHPEIGRVTFSGGMLGTVRAFPAAGHMIYYLIDDTQVNVLRVLHARMDVTGLLDD